MRLLGHSVLYFANAKAAPEAALVVYEHSQALVNLTVFDQHGRPRPQGSVWSEDASERPAGSPFFRRLDYSYSISAVEPDPEPISPEGVDPPENAQEEA